MRSAPLAVSEVFGPTFQGEGRSVGQRAGFVRLTRCNLDCQWCDTPYTWDWDRFDRKVEVRLSPVGKVLAELDAMVIDRVVITGGEPLLQQRQLLPLVEACYTRGWGIEIETNGTIAPDSEIVGMVSGFNVSPKLANSGIAEDRRIRPAALRSLMATGRAAFKFVATDVADLDEIDEIAKGHSLAPVWVMPEGTDAATVAARLRVLADAVLERGWNLTPRLHVLLWGDERGR